MIDRSKLIREINACSDRLFTDFTAEHTYAKKIWERICNDSSLCYSVRGVSSSYGIPRWEGPLNTVCPITPLQNYSVLSVDGSQIYPDKHEGTPCYLINIGDVTIRYGNGRCPVTLNSEPYLFTGVDSEIYESKIDGVNCKRQELELSVGLKKSIAEKNYGSQNCILLFDGSLIFWHLETKEEELRCYLDVYLDLLDQMYHAAVPFASYMSLPKHKEVSNILRVVEDEPQNIEHVTDAAVMHWYLHPHTRSLVFTHQGDIVREYPPHLRPHFFYINVGNEIGRVEIPAWIATCSEYVDLIASVVLDQSIKGNGYPIVIAEAHEQAVVKGADREFFYQLIAQAAVEQKRRLRKSVKSSRKRRIGI